VKSASLVSDMRSVRSAAFAAALVVLVPPIALTWAPAAHAQARKPVREQLPLEARGHWDAALALAAKKNWDGARTSFTAAYDLSKNPRVLFNVAIAEKELERYPAAIDALRRELAEGKGQLTPDEEKDIQGFIAGLEKFVGQLTIEVSERDADVYVDDEKIDSTKLPGPFTVKIGTRRVRAVRSGFTEAVESVTLAGGGTGKVTLKLNLAIRTARVNVSVVGPANAIVKIDGMDRGPAPYSGQVPVTADPHQFTAEAPGYVTATQSALVKDGEVLNLTLQLAPDQEKGKLLVVAKPEGATIEIDGKFAGATKWEGPVSAGTHQVVVKKLGYYTWTHDVEVPKGGERPISATLNEDRNTSYVPWVVGTIVVGAALVVGIVLLATPPDEPVQKGTLSPFVLGTQSTPGFRF
jgi:hypothetical protein